MVIVDSKSWQPPPALGATAAAPTTGATIVATIGWLAVGGVAGAALWALAHEVLGVRRGAR